MYVDADTDMPMAQNVAINSKVQTVGASNSLDTLLVFDETVTRAGVEQCDDGLANNDTAACTAICEINVCGDGKPLSGIEGCDDGNQVDTDACRNDCTMSPGR
ncbi:MAG: DUF4215 domain-containing protein [Sphingomonadales bacterium]|nr:DUF4215 domain-containing protein [Sphingomonadales bacterium]